MTQSSRFIDAMLVTKENRILLKFQRKEMLHCKTVIKRIYHRLDYIT